AAGAARRPPAGPGRPAGAARRVRRGGRARRLGPRPVPLRAASAPAHRTRRPRAGPARPRRAARGPRPGPADAGRVPGHAGPQRGLRRHARPAPGRDRRRPSRRPPRGHRRTRFAARLRGRRRPVQDLLVPPPGRRPARTGPEGGRAGARRLRGGAGAHPRRRAGRAVAPGGPGRGLPAGPCPLRRPRRTCRNPKGARMTATPAPHEQAVRDGASPAGTDEAARAAATRADLEKRFAGLALPTRIHLDGQDADAVDGATFDRVSPRDGTVIARVSAGGEKDIDRAVASARRAFESGVWSGRHPRERRAVLRRLARLIEEHAEELALLESVDMGKPYTDALAVDLRVTLQCLDFYAEAAD